MFESSQETQLSSMMRSHGAAFTGDVITRFHALAGGRQSHGGEYNVKTVALGEQLAAISFDSILFVIDVRSHNPLLRLLLVRLLTTIGLPRSWFRRQGL
jgi:hypothetical protein